MIRNPISGQTRREELVNALTHGIGFGLSIAALVILVVFAAQKSDPWKIVSFSIYGAALITLYSASTIYHAINYERGKRILQIIDHSSIFILIAGTYTPYLLVNMRGVWGWSLFGFIWGLAWIGIISKAKNGTMGDKRSVIIYLIMGWIIIIAFKKMIDTIQIMGFVWLLIGGISYSLGVILFMLGNKLPYSHSIWHLFVLGGSITHFFGILFYVLPY